MTRPDVHLVRCAGCGHNFETRRFGELSCPTCRARIWLEPPPGVEPDTLDPEPEDVDNGEKEAPAVEAEPGGPDDDQSEAGAAPDEAGLVDQAGKADEPAEDSDQGQASGEVEPEGAARLFEAADGLVRKAQPPPWETPGASALRRFGATLRLVLLRPGLFFAALPSRGYGRAFLFGWIACTIGVVCFSLYGLWQVDANREAHLQLLRSNADLESLGYTAEQALDLWRAFLSFSLFAAPLVAAVNIWVSAGLNHIGVLLVAGRGRRFAATFRASAYAFAPMVVLILPAIGNLIGFIWVVLLQVIAIGQVHRLSLGRATLAVVMPLFSVLMLLLLPGS